MSSFGKRVILLLGLMTAVAAVDWARNGRLASKYREYGFILIAGVIGAFVGFGNDLITASISPEYYIYGKDLESGSDLRWRAGVFGFKEGMSAGIIGGAICLFVTAQKSSFSKDQIRCLFSLLWMPLMGAVLFGLVLPIVAGKFDPFGLAIKLTSLLGDEQTVRFLRVWWAHLGLYTGTAIGMVAMIVRTRSRRPVTVGATAARC